MSCTVGAVTEFDFAGTNMQFVWLRQNSSYQLTDSGAEAINGFLDPMETRVTAGLTVIDFTVMLEPTISDLDVILPKLCFAESPTDTFTMDQTLDSFTTILAMGPKFHTISTCYIDKAIFRHQRGSTPLRLELRIFGTSESLADADPGVAAFADGVGYPFPDVTVNVPGLSDMKVDRVAIGIDNKVMREWNNSTTLTSACPTAREIYLATSSPYTDTEEAVYSTPAGGTLSTAGGSVVWNRGDGRSTTFTFEHLQLLAKPPDILGKDKEVRLDQFYRAYRTASAPALVVTHDATV